MFKILNIQSLSYVSQRPVGGIEKRVCTWNTRMWTLGKHVLQIQVEVFHAVATTAENGEDGPYNLAVLIAYQLTAKS